MGAQTLTSGTFSLHGNRQSAWGAPVSGAHPCQQGHVGQPSIISPFRDRKCLSVKGKKQGTSFVSCLFLSGCPPYVTRSVPKVIIYAVQRMRRARFSAYVLEKSREIIEPRAAYFYASSAIGVVTLVFLTVATGFHATPSLILCTVFSFAFCATVGTRPHAGNFPRITTATGDITSLKVTRPGDFMLSTTTQTQPVRPTFSALYKPNNCKPAELLSSQVNKVSAQRSFWAMIISSHAVYSLKVNKLVKVSGDFLQSLTPAYSTINTMSMGGV